MLVCESAESPIRVRSADLALSQASVISSSARLRLTPPSVAGSLQLGQALFESSQDRIHCSISSQLEHRSEELTWEQKECPHGMLTGPVKGSLHIEHNTLRSRRENWG